MDVSKPILGRRSIREYTSQTVDDETIHHLIEAAIYAPMQLTASPGYLPSFVIRACSKVFPGSPKLTCLRRILAATPIYFDLP